MGSLPDELLLGAGPVGGRGSHAQNLLNGLQHSALATAVCARHKVDVRAAGKAEEESGHLQAAVRCTGAQQGMRHGWHELMSGLQPHLSKSMLLLGYQASLCAVCAVIQKVLTGLNCTLRPVHTSSHVHVAVHVHVAGLSTRCIAADTTNQPLADQR